MATMNNKRAIMFGPQQYGMIYSGEGEVLKLQNSNTSVYNIGINETLWCEQNYVDSLFPQRYSD